MEPASALSQRGHVPWQGLLLSVSLLTFWSPPTTARLALELMPANATKGKDVLFLVYNQTENLIGYAWFKGPIVNSSRQIASYRIDTQSNATGTAYSGRETIYPNGSLLFQNVTLEDTGSYTLQALNTDLQAELVTGQLRVYPELLKPTITSNTSDPVEHKGPVVFTCESEIQDVTYLWLINSQSVQNSTRLELSEDNRTLTLLNVTRSDTGPYECEIRNPVTAIRSDPFYLNVLYDSPQESSGLSDGAIAGIVIGVLAGIALIATLVYFLYIRKTGGASDQRDLTDHKPSASSHSPGHSDISPNKIDEVAYSSLNFSAQESNKPTSASPSSTATETVYSELKK
ncbi:carcinoembryonic antigen-related cell adhesion molecule 7-like isoform X3 [Rhinolophus ferrumequinum]|uniref:carcinoembryonic antigen-related cell adhesion molecule 7-like isoform X3 n=1 Tax=Rhinolophus ferrumequinum TaxID=59479 RepID=UPI00140FF528|nr:carcinoembryonic antigen-related cell adhesion molecule 7-like isoform X3 [Rhinolophus ferrumequinum]